MAFDVYSKDQRFLWVEFKASDGSIDRRTAQVEIVGPCPSVSEPVTPTPTPIATPTPTIEPTPTPSNVGIGGPGGGGGGGGGTPTQPTTKTISQVRVAENPGNLQTALWKGYTQGMVLSHTFVDPAPGEKFIFVQFADNKSQIVKINGQDYISSSIELIAEQAAPAPPAGVPTAGSCQDSCGACATKNTFGNTTYDTCDTSPCSKSGATATTTFTCYAKDNNNCQGTYYCGSGASGGTPSTGGSCTIGKTCTCGDTTIGDTRNPGSCSDCNGGWCNGGQCATCKP